MLAYFTGFGAFSEWWRLRKGFRLGSLEKIHAALYWINNAVEGPQLGCHAVVLYLLVFIELPLQRKLHFEGVYTEHCEIVEINTAIMLTSWSLAVVLVSCLTGMVVRKCLAPKLKPN